MSETVILSGQCELVGETSHLYNLTLSCEIFLYERSSRGCCICSRKSGSLLINLHDVYGAKVLRSNDTEDMAAYFQIFACPQKKMKRKGKRMCFRVVEFDDVDLNLNRAQEWVRAITWLVKDPAVDITKIRDGPLPAARKLLVLINPSSGQGKSLRVFEEKVEPMLKDADINYKAIVTEYANHGKEIAHHLDVTEWDGIVICSGDGLVHEVVNGLLERADWEKAIQMPVGIIPTGSGNALCFGSLHSLGEQPLDLTSAIYAVIRGYTQPLDICSVVTPTQKMYSFLSVAWGIISDVDIESEKYRYMGNTRFLVGAVVRIMGLRIYRGRLSYLPADGQREGRHDHVENEIIANELAESFHSSAGDDEEPRAYHVVGPSQAGVDYLPQVEEKPHVTEYKHKTLSEPNELASPFGYSCNGISVSGNVCSSRGPPTDKLAPLDQPVPTNWKVVEGEFVFICPVYISHLNPDTNIAPESKFGDGLIYIAYVKSSVSRASLISMLLKMESGDHVSCSDFTLVKAHAFRLEPDLDQNGIIAVDGEMIPYTPVQAQIHKGLARVMCWREPNHSF